jgi:predicted RNase H-like HicB family nuclease
MRCSILVEPADAGFSAYSPAGCISTGPTADEVEANLREAVQGHLEGCAVRG